jgi:hypothetical protein
MLGDPRKKGKMSSSQNVAKERLGKKQEEGIEPLPSKMTTFFKYSVTL